MEGLLSMLLRPVKICSTSQANTEAIGKGSAALSAAMHSNATPILCRHFAQTVRRSVALGASPMHAVTGTSFISKL